MTKRVQPRPDKPQEAASRAHNIAESVTRELLRYCEQPSDADDRGRHFDDLISELEEVKAVLAKTADLRGGSAESAPDQRLIRAIQNAVDVVVLVHVRTHVKRALETEADLVSLRRALSEATPPEHD